MTGAQAEATVQWVPDGPRLPVEILEALEEGDLIFFCGAGLSVPAGLPGFRGLVERVHHSFPDRSKDVEALTDSKEYDRAFYALVQCPRNN